MKLLTKTNIYFFCIALIMFSFGGVIFYQRMNAINKMDADEKLAEEKVKVADYVNLNNTLPRNNIFLGDSVVFTPINLHENDKIGHFMLYNLEEKEYEPSQTLAFSILIDNQFYRATIYRPLLEANDLTTAIAEAIAIIVICLLVVLLFSNFVITKIMWAPFYKTLEKIKSFDISKESPPGFAKTTIHEFNILNDVFESMTKKITSDYISLKEFAENASHELQTPLATIRSKLELLIQSEKLTEKQMEQIQVVYESAVKLSKLNQALLVLAKIENRQFSSTKSVALMELIDQKLEAFSELLIHKNISVQKNLTTFSLQMNPILTNILLNNLIGNAIKHNINSGQIVIELTSQQLSIANTGTLLTIPPEKLFERFQKSDSSSDSLGLGLAIVKEICNVYGFHIQYEFAENTHTITVRF
ncbi:MAG TPA: HAMP domain-containing sensor histidine kinase [Bacteroidia bacterium]|nr:HAMP domain-containing sensor histidine kinase [Bacteroidia bacterium]